ATSSVDATRSTKTTVASFRSMQRILWSGRAATKAALPRADSGRCDLRDQLLLVEQAVRPVVVRRHGRRVRVTGSAGRHRRRGIDTEVIADERLGRADARRMWRIQLWIPRVRRQSDVLADRREVRVIELHGC